MAGLPDYYGTMSTTPIWNGNAAGNYSITYVNYPDPVAEPFNVRYVPKREQSTPFVPLRLGTPGRIPEHTRVRVGKQRVWTGRNFRRVV